MISAPAKPISGVCRLHRKNTALPAFLLLFCVTFTVGCVPNRPYRLGAYPAPSSEKVLSNIVERASSEPAATPNYDLAYIEFDDMGEYWTIGNLNRTHGEPRSQLDAAVDLIAKRKRETAKPVAVIAFIHGWKNNASEYDEGHKNLAGFKAELQQLAQHDPAHSYIGIFLAWRGQSVGGDLFATYWNRRNAARRVGGPSMTEALFRLMFVTKPPVPPAPTDENQCGAPVGSSSGPRNVFILIGHSFGVRVLERAISQPLMAMIYERQSEAVTCRKVYDQTHPDHKLNVLTFDSPADLIVTINAANDAFEAKAMIEGMRRMNLRACSGETCLSKGQFFDAAPIIVSILSNGDWITRKLMPVAQAISYPSQNLNRKYDKDAAGEGELVGTKQHSFFLHNEGSIDQLISHRLTACGGSANPCSTCQGVIKVPAESQNRPPAFQLAPVGLDLTSCQISNSASLPATGTGARSDAKGAKFVNNTPFWVFTVPTEIIPNHSDIFKPGASELLQAIVEQQIVSGKKSISVAAPSYVAEPEMEK